MVLGMIVEYNPLFTWDPGFFLLYRIGPLPFSLTCRKRGLKSDPKAAFPIIRTIAAGWVVPLPNPIFFLDVNRVWNGNQLACETPCGLIGYKNKPLQSCD